MRKVGDAVAEVRILLRSSRGLRAERPSGAKRARGWKRGLGEPLLHFVIIGLGLFLLDASWNGGFHAPRGSREISLTATEVHQLQSTFRGQWQRPPSAEEMRELVETAVRQEVLARQAIELGLDRDDTIIKRRLAQKMEFLAADTGLSHSPSPAELEGWFEKNRETFALPSRLSFRHLYFSPDRRGDGAREDARKALARLGREPLRSKLLASLADPFMFQDHYADRTRDEVSREFGPAFAVALEKLPLGTWEGPVESGYGWHLVFVESVVPARIPTLDEVSADVRSAWMTEQKQRAWRDAYEHLRAKYTIRLPTPEELESTKMIPRPTEVPSGSGESPR